MCCVQGNDWLDNASKLATVMVAVFVAFIGYRQLQTAREKLRLDLYERRFAIYTTTLDFYLKVILGDWQSDPDTELSSRRFTVAVQESQFLFDESSGVHSFLREFSNKAFHVIQMKKGNLSAKDLGHEIFTVEYKKFMDELSWINENLPSLDKKMAPYLNFRKI